MSLITKRKKGYHQSRNCVTIIPWLWSLSTVTCPLSYPVLEIIRKVLGVTLPLSYFALPLSFTILSGVAWKRSTTTHSLHNGGVSSGSGGGGRGLLFTSNIFVIYGKYFYTPQSVCTGPLRRRGEGGLLRTSPLMTTSGSDTAPTSDTGAGIRPLLSRWDWLMIS